MRERARLAVTLACLAMGACGGGDDSSGTAPTTTPTSGDEGAAPTASDTDAGPTDDAAPAADPSDEPVAPTPTAPSLAEARAHFDAGMRAYNANDFQRAADELAAADALVPSPELAYNVAYCAMRMGDPARSIRYFERYLETGNPDERERRRVDGWVTNMRALEARHREITMALPPTLDETQRDAAALFESGLAMFQRRRYAPAMQAFSAAYAAFEALGVELPELLYNLGVTAERTDQFGDAALYFDRYLRVRPDDPDSATIRAHIAELRARRGRH